MLRNRGFIGLVALLVAFAILSLLVWRTDLFQGKSSVGSSLDGEEEKGPPKSMMERNLDAVQSAKDAKAKVEARNKEVMSEE